jgi:hypothetical protein
MRRAVNHVAGEPCRDRLDRQIRGARRWCLKKNPNCTRCGSINQHYLHLHHQTIDANLGSRSAVNGRKLALVVTPLTCHPPCVSHGITQMHAN